MRPGELEWIRPARSEMMTDRGHGYPGELASLQLHANCGVHSGLQGNFCKYHELARHGAMEGHDPANDEETRLPR